MIVVWTELARPELALSLASITTWICQNVQFLVRAQSEFLTDLVQMSELKVQL